MATTTKRSEQQAEALHRAQTGFSKNDAYVYAMLTMAGFEDVEPRVNVFTFNAWKAAGRSVKKGEKGLAITTWIPCKDKKATPDPVTGEIKKGLRPKTAYVFHVSQTIETGTKQEPASTPEPAPAEPQTGMIVAPASNIIDVEYTIERIEPKRLTSTAAQKQLSLF
jgi:hypothetical protein